MDNAKDKSFDTLNSLLSVTANNNAILNTILDVLIAMHLEGKTEDEKSKFMESIDKKTSEYFKSSTSLFLEKP
jgi:hypothetical protein